MNPVFLLVIAIVGTLPLLSCRPHNEFQQKFYVIPGEFVYSILEHKDSIYFSTQRGEVVRFHHQNPRSVHHLGRARFQPLRTLIFKKNNQLFASSYETGVQHVLPDTLVSVQHLWRSAWAMISDSSDNLWLAGRQGVFREQGDTLLRVTTLREAYDIDFYLGFLAVAHRQGVTLFDTTTFTPCTTYCKGVVCWSLDVFDSLLVAGGVETCALIWRNKSSILSIRPRYTIPWGAVQDSAGTIYLATQNGIYSIVPNTKRAECIAYKGKCIKSIFIDHTNKVWIGRYFPTTQ